MVETIEPLELVGRDAELTAARRWAMRVAEDGPAGLLIEGEAGIGKSRMWRAALELGASAGATVLQSRPVEAELPYGYAALGDLLAEVVQPVLARLHAPQARALAAALSIEPMAAAGDPLLVGRALTATLELLARDAPVVLAVDDAQWLDGPSARALAFAIRRLNGLPVGIAIALRQGHPDPLRLADALGDRVDRVQLAGLSLGATGRLLRAVVDPAMPRLAVIRIQERSGGNPMFSVQLARGGSERLPSSLRDVVAAALDAVPSEARGAIERAAVIGPAPAAALGDPDALDAAIAAAVLVEDGGQVRFSHPLVAAAAYERIPPARRRALHRAAADGASRFETRARHLALGSDAPDASIAQVVEDAALAAMARGAPETAVALVEHARRLTAKGDHDALARRTMEQADFLFVAGDERGARGLAEELVDQGVRGAIRVRALALQSVTSRDARTAVDLLESAAKEPHADVELQARTLAQLAWQRGAWLGDIAPALDEARRALALAERAGVDATLVTALTSLGLLSSLALRPDAARHFERALEILARVPAAAGDHTPRLAYAIERWWRGHFARAEELLAEERAIATAQGNDGLHMRLDMFGGEFALRRGDWDQAERLLEDALADARDYWRATALVRRAILRARRGDPRALADADELRAMPIDDPSFAGAGDFAEALLLAAAGRVTEAAPLAFAVLERSDRSGSRGPELAMLTPEAVSILVAAGRFDEAGVLTEQLERRHDQLAPWGDAAASLCRGIMEMAAPPAVGAVPGAAMAHLAAARAGFEAIDAPWELGQTLLALGMLLRRAGQRTRAGEAIDAAVAIFERLGAEPARLRALDELRRARPRPRSDDRLTAAEARVASLVAQGTPNREVAAQLFTTVATVEAHLTHIYAKLDIRSRTELARKVSDGSLQLEE